MIHSIIPQFMPYSEIHFNSAVVTDAVKFSGTRGRRVLELNCPLQINRFHVKDLELPLTFCNIAGGTFVMSLNLVETIFTGNRYGVEFSTAVVFPEGCYTGSSFKIKFQELIRQATLEDSGGLSTKLIEAEVSTDETGHLKISNLDIWENDNLAVRSTYEFYSFSITWSEELKSLVSRAYDDYGLKRTTETTTWSSRYPLRIVPNYVYLHSNLMSGVPYNSVQRAIGSYNSKTIVTKIQIDTSYEWMASIMPWRNTSLNSEMMFELGAAEFNQLEFWFTDENGIELDLMNVNFSLTLAVIYR
jgi:hypothetical protein